MRSCASGEIWESGQDQKTWELQQRHEQENSGYAGDELTGCWKFWKTIVQWVAVIELWVYKWCANDVGCTKVKDRANVSEIPDVVEAQASKWRNLIGKGEMGIKDETKIASWGSDGQISNKISL